MDEATSALDDASEKAVQDALERSKIGRTTIIVTHRLSTIKNADLIVCLHQGRPNEVGTHEELISLKGQYHQFVIGQTKSLSSKRVEVVKNKKEDKDEMEVGSKTRSLLEYERKLIRYHKSESFWLFFGTIFRIFNGCSYALIYIIFVEIVNIFSIESNQEKRRLSIQYMIVLLVIILFNTLAMLFTNYAFELSGARLTTKLRVKMFESMLRQEIAFHDLEENKPSILASQLLNSPGFCRGLMSDKISILVQSLSGVCLAAIICFTINWKLTFIMLVFVFIVIISGIYSGRISLNNQSNKRSDDVLTVETFDNIRTIVSFNLEKHFIEDFSNINTNKTKRNLWNFNIHALLYSISNCITFFVYPTVFSYGLYSIKNEGLTVANLLKVSFLLYGR